MFRSNSQDAGHFDRRRVRVLGAIVWSLALVLRADGSFTRPSPPEGPRNRLAGQPSAYLSSAARQPVNWFPWSPGAFAAAQKQDKPILLDIGAVWCHWCHVMDREDYENPQIASLINQDFIAIKVDRDERPDIDRRYQLAVRYVGGSNGWPLTAFLTPTGEVFFGGTYFPAEDGPGGPGMKSLLPKLADFYQANKQGIAAKSYALVKQLARIQRGEAKRPGKFSAGTVREIERQTLEQHDSENGGFSRSPGPKFFEAEAIEFLLARAAGGSSNSLAAATRTLEKMADGGVRDRLDGGFHRYSTDMFWRVPHFEKMAYDQAPLLRAYLHAYQLTGREGFRDVANGIVDYVLHTLSSSGAGFFAFQDADVSPNDDGSYFTWTQKEIAAVLSPAESRVVSARYGIEAQPKQFRELPDRQVLAVAASWETVAKKTSFSRAEVETLDGSALSKLREARRRRKAPFVDRTVFADYNGMLISAFLDAWRVLGRQDAKARALDAYDFARSHLLDKNGTFFHAYGNGQARVSDLLADQVWMALAATDVYQTRGGQADLDLARRLMDHLWDSQRDAKLGGFFDLPLGAHRDNPYLAEPGRPIEDNPEASGNAVAIWTLERLSALTGDAVWSRRAAETLDAFAGTAAELRSFGGAYATAGLVYTNPGAHVVIVGKRADSRVEDLYAAAFRVFRPGSTAMVISRETARDAPPIVVAQIGSMSGGGPVAFVCAGSQCALPTADPARVIDLVRSFGRK